MPTVSDTPCKRHKWVVVRETKLQFSRANGTPTKFYWTYQFRQCSVCGSEDSRWKPGGQQALAASPYR